MSTEALMIGVFILFFACSFVPLMRQNSTFAFYYAFLFLYTIFTQIGYVYYPHYTWSLSAQQYYGPRAFPPYWAFIFSSFVLIFLLGRVTLSRRIALPLHLNISPGKFVLGSAGSVSHLFYFLACIALQGFLVIELLSNYQILSYRTAEVLKGNKIWHYALYLNSLACYVSFVVFFHRRNSSNRIQLLAVFLSSLAIGIATNVRMGGRIILFYMVTAFVGYFLPMRTNPFSRRFIVATLKVASLAFLGILFSQTITAIRGEGGTMDEFLSTASHVETAFSRLYNFENLLTQDYFVPSLTLATSIQYDIIDPAAVLHSNITSLVPLVIEHVTMGGYFVRLLNPAHDSGYGYYILTEGFNFAGWLGIIYNAIVFVFGFKLLHTIFCETNDEAFNQFMRGALAFAVISIVRGQSMYFIKSIYFVLVPAAVLYTLAIGCRITVRRRGRS